MIVTYNWLKEFVDFDVSPADLAHLLTMLGLEVEGMQSTGEGLDDVVVALVEEKQQHPNADKLSLCKVNDGRDILSIVCGAQNFKSGDKVALARIGSVLPGDFKIKRSKIRGEESFGMLCSQRELGISEESAGIMILPADFKLGTPVFTALGLKDTIFEIGLTPNRADCLSVIGVAREIAAKLGKKLRYPVFEVPEAGAPIGSIASVTIEAPDLCPRYTARVIQGCSIAPSPQWLVNRLTSAGIRSINNVVDVTNYVLLEYGHPLHAFDLDHLAGGCIIVRRAGDGEVFKSLDGQDRMLEKSDLTIRDKERAVALAGIMGGENSEISPSTTNILLESAFFNPSAIRKTSKRLGMHTESSHRFERGADRNIVVKALDRAARLIAELAGGTVARGLIDAHPHPAEPRVIRTGVERVNALLGLALSTDEIAAIFRNLEFDVVREEPGTFKVTIPSFRVDIEREIDLVEEVARLNGYEKIPFTMPMAKVFSDRPTLQQRIERKLKDILVGVGFNEVINFSFIAPEVCDKLLLPSDDYRRRSIRLLNPLVEEQSAMRTSLLPGLLETSAKNSSFRVLNQKIFELRRVYIPKDGSVLPEEELWLAGLITGSRNPEGWNQGKEDVDFYDVKGVIEGILQDFRIGGVSFLNDGIETFYHPGKACSITRGNDIIGSMGEIHPDVQGNFEIERPVYYFEVNVQKLVQWTDPSFSVIAPSRFPETFRDIAMLISDDVPSGEVVQTIGSLKIVEVGGVEIFDLYRGEHVPAGQKSLAVRIRFRSSERTLTDEEVSRLNQKITAQLQKKYNITVR